MAGNPYRQITLPSGQRITVPANSAGGILANANARSSFEQSANAPIPGMTGTGRPTPPGLQGVANGLAGGALSQYMNNEYTPDQWRGLLPMMTLPQAGGPFQSVGPYGQQAMRMAGLLGQIPQQPGQMQGLLGTPKQGLRMMYGNK